MSWPYPGEIGLELVPVHGENALSTLVIKISNDAHPRFRCRGNSAFAHDSKAVGWQRRRTGSSDAAVVSYWSKTGKTTHPQDEES